MRVIPHFVLWNFGLRKPESQTNQIERNCLARHAAGRSRLVEIGVWHGVTTARLRAVMAAEGVLFAVDPFPAGRLGFSAQRLIARHETGRIKRGKLEWVRLTGTAAARHPAITEGGGVDFIFIDGDHSYDGLRADWEVCNPLLCDGGIVALHDSRSSSTRQIDDAGSVVFTKMVILKDPRFELLEVADTLTVLKRTRHASTQ
jgi:predicted O-methyltransferase YrrM